MALIFAATVAGGWVLTRQAVDLATKLAEAVAEVARMAPSSERSSQS